MKDPNWIRRTIWGANCYWISDNCVVCWFFFFFKKKVFFSNFFLYNFFFLDFLKMSLLAVIFLLLWSVCYIIWYTFFCVITNKKSENSKVLNFVLVCVWFCCSLKLVLRDNFDDFVGDDLIISSLYGHCVEILLFILVVDEFMHLFNYFIFQQSPIVLNRLFYLC